MKMFAEFIEGCRLIMSVDPTVSTGAEHDEIYLYGKLEKDEWSEEVKSKLDELGFNWFDDCWMYYT